MGWGFLFSPKGAERIDPFSPFSNLVTEAEGVGTEWEKSWYDTPKKVPRAVSCGFRNMGVFRTPRPSVGALTGKSHLRVCEDPPGGPGVKNPPAIVRDRGLIPGPGRFHVLRGNEAQAPQLLSPGAQQQEGPPPRGARPRNQGAAHPPPQPEQAPRRNEDPAPLEINI